MKYLNDFYNINFYTLGIISTRFVEDLRDLANEWQARLLLISDIVDEWLFF
jgi:hypothetical protein